MFIEVPLFRNTFPAMKYLLLSTCVWQAKEEEDIKMVIMKTMC